MGEWRQRPIRELCSQIIDCVNKTAPTVEGPTAWRMIRTTNVRDGRVNLDQTRYVEEGVYKKWVRRGTPRTGDIILTREAPLGEVGRLRDDAGVFLGQRLVLYRPDEDEVDGSFLFAAMRAPGVQNQIKAFGSGSTVEHMRVPDCEELRVGCPPLSEQRKIGALLSAFDDQIEISDRRIELLEELARSLYREWFVNFRFPGHGTSRFVDSELGRIPNGWTPTVASRIFDFNPRVGGQGGGPYPKVTMGDVSTRFSHVLPSESASRASGARYRHGDVLMARITPSLENGKTGLALFLEPEEVGIGSTELIVVRGRDVGPAFTYCAARSQPFRDHAIKSMSGASGRQRVASDCFESLPMVEPADEVVTLFESAAMPMLEEVLQLRLYSNQLAETRDLLLPRLVTGQLDISDVDLGVLTSPEPE